ncbi:TRAP transporter small permease [Desulfocurvus vexinensis]|uniref:TRAP transporter small permease n=1 Tax=Desulfocurvus vexinensis TaxID=399548 RepID=UPI0004BB02E5|nr:TRAP transporter small permease [Desulfocurvus vexinensis]
MATIRMILNRFEEGVISLLLAAMTLEVFVEVILRYGFNTGLLWGTELTLHLGAWMVLFGASYGIKVGSHIGVDAFLRVQPPAARRVISTLAVLGAMCYCVLVMIGAWAYLAKMYAIGIELQDIPVPRWMAHSILFIGYVMLFARLLELLVRVVTGKADGFKLPDEAKEGIKMYVKRGAGGATAPGATPDGGEVPRP